MSRVFGHTNRNNFGVCCYRLVKGYRTECNQALRCNYIRSAEKDPEGSVDINLTKVENIWDRTNYPGDFW
jgi:hypothetical protein